MGNPLGFGAITDWGTFTGAGGGTVYNIPHTMTSVPDYAFVIAASNAAALTPFYISSIDGTNIVVTYTAITGGGAGAIVLRWGAGRQYSVRDEVRSVIEDSIPDD